MSNTLDWLLETTIGKWIDDPTVEEVCVNRPGEVWVFQRGIFSRHEVPGLDATAIEDLAIVAAAQRQQDIGFGRSLLSTDINGRGRLQAVLAPNVAEGFPCLTIRRGSDVWPTLQQLADVGLFMRTKSKRVVKRKIDDHLMELYRAERWPEFLAAGIRAKKTTLACGMTASGKTHISKALIGEIPLDERLISIEDALELKDIPHPNRVQMYYDKDKAGAPKAQHLVEAALRMRIGRLFLQELRDGFSALAFLIAEQTGHKGGITTIHAPHCLAAFARLRTMIKTVPDGQALDNVELNEQLFSLIDIVVHSTREDGPFEADEIIYVPALLEEWEQEKLAARIDEEKKRMKISA